MMREDSGVTLRSLTKSLEKKLEKYGAMDVMNIYSETATGKGYYVFVLRDKQGKEHRIRTAATRGLF